MPFAARRVGLYALVAVVTLLGVEVGARVVELARDALLPPKTGETAFAVLANPAPAFERGSRDGSGRELYRRTKQHWLPPRETFLAEKPPGGVRIFSLGGSAALGWPHGADGGYARMLQTKLRKLYPTRTIEVVNAAGNTYASYRVRVVFDEIVEYEPDVILVWSGNNEFLERIVYGMVLPPWPWDHSAVARILHAASGRARAAKPVVDVKSYVEADLVANRIGTAFGRTSQLRADPEQYERVVAHYRHNLETMAREARRRGIPLVLIDVPVNLKDWHPNASFHREDLSEAELREFQTHYREGVLASERGATADAARAFSQALAIDDTHAETNYLYARALHASGRVAQARTAYERTLAVDACPFRDVPSFREVRRDVARRFDLPLVDAPGVLAARAADGIPGLDVFVDYVHPTLASNERIAQAVLATLAREALIPAERARPLESARLRVPEDGSTNLRVLLKLYPQFLIMRQYERIGPVAQAIQRAARPRPEDPPERVESLTSLSERVRGWQRVLVPYQKLLRAEKLGTLEQEFTPERARRVYQRYVDLVKELEARDLAESEFAKLVPELDYAPTADE